MKQTPTSVLPEDLTPRQRQILRLLQEGKVNKEVAEELGIGLGTVKQHIVALFRKLKVTNRAMAVSRGMDLLNQQDKPSRALMVDGLLERRPCVVLCLALPEEASSPAQRFLRGVLAEAASIHDAVFVARKGNVSEVIFGIQQAREYDLALAVRTAGEIYRDMLEVDPLAAESLSGSLLAGFAVASMRRFGGWTGEAIASGAIAEARQLLGQTAPGFLALDRSALELLEVFGVGNEPQIGPLLPFRNIEKVHWSGARPGSSLVGRSGELASLGVILSKAETGRGALVQVTGELGMGKSRLCEEIFAQVLGRGGEAEYFRCLPQALGGRFYDVPGKEYCSLEKLIDLLKVTSLRYPALLIIDDFHLLPPDEQDVLSQVAAAAVAAGRVTVFAGRKKMLDETRFHVARIRLRRMPGKAIESLVEGHLGAGTSGASRKQIRHIVDLAGGVPLFALDLVRRDGASVPSLPLQLVIAARLDGRNLDRLLLQELARHPKAVTAADLSEGIGEDRASVQAQVELAVKAGVLREDAATGLIDFTHPMLRQALSATRVR